MPTTVGDPYCVKCGRGRRYDSASLMGNEPFFLVPAVGQTDGLYQGKTWVIFCGNCLKKLIKCKQDLSNLIPKTDIFIVIEKGNVSIRMN